jgi:ethanolamine ammonia-lyase large subunit
MKLSTTIGGTTFDFKSLKEVLAKANEEKSGDTLAGISASCELERVAAKRVLTDVTLGQLRNNPVIPLDEDDVGRRIDDSLETAAFQRLQNWSVGELREFILATSTDCDAISVIRWGLNGEMAAAVTKLMSSLDLVVAAKKCQVISRARTTLGLPGRLGARLQPNHPSDAIDGVRASIYEGLSYGVGDAVIGINPACGTPDTVARLLETTDQVIRELNLPAQNCVLSHVSTQMKAIEHGAQSGLIFQSIAGCEKGNRAFGIDSNMLDEAYDLGKRKCNNPTKSVMYFETGQGAELSSRTHNDADQVTLEARCYAYARLFKPFLVNDVCGFIGPEYLADGRQMIRAGLEDHFMGKLLGVPMGIDACYTNHMKADQNDLENLALLLSCAGVNYFMGVPMGDDVMLSYQTTSFHDVATLRELLNLRPAPEFERWLETVGLMKNGKLTKNAGDASYVMGLKGATV